MLKLSNTGALFGVIALAATSAANAQSVGMATSQPGSFYHSQATVLSAVLTEKAGVQARVQPYSSPNVHLPAVNAGQIEIGLANSFESGLALSGADYFKGRANPNLRMISITSQLRTGLFVQKDSPVKTIADLKGKRMPWRFPAQNIIMPLLYIQLESVGLGEKDIVAVPVPTVVRGADDFMAGRTDVFIFALGAGKVTEVDAAVKGLRALPLEDTPATRAAIKKHFPQSYIETVNPRPGLAGVSTPTAVQTYDGVMVTFANAPEELIYRITKAMWENAAAIAKGSPTLAGFAQGKMAKNVDPVQYHPGAIKFYQEKGLWPPK